LGPQIGRTSSLVLTLCGVLKNVGLVFFSAIVWSTVVTPTQIVGYSLSTLGLLYYSLGIETIRGAFYHTFLFAMHRDGSNYTNRKHRKRVIAAILLISIICAGAIGGILAGLKMELDPRAYWYSMRKMTDIGSPFRT
jgi:hypothetical protein